MRLWGKKADLNSVKDLLSASSSSLEEALLVSLVATWAASWRLRSSLYLIMRTTEVNWLIINTVYVKGQLLLRVPPDASNKD